MDVSLFCLVGHETTTDYEDIFCTMCSNWEWFKFPLNIQKLLPMILSSAEKPVYLKGYIGVYCTRDFIKTVSNAIIGYGYESLKFIDIYISVCSKWIFIFYDTATVQLMCGKFEKILFGSE